MLHKSAARSCWDHDRTRNPWVGEIYDLLGKIRLWSLEIVFIIDIFFYFILFN